MSVQEAPPTTPGRPSPFAGPRPAVALLLAINLFNYIDRYILAAVEGDISKEIFPPGSVDADNAKTKMGLLFTAFLISYMVLAPFFGFLADRWRRWVVIGLGVTLWSVASAGSGLATTFTILLLMRVMVGVGEAAYGPTAPTIIADLYPVERRGSVLAWFYAAIPVGSALGYVIGGQVSHLLSWHWAFFVTLPPGILLAVLCFMHKEVPRGRADAKPGVKFTFADYRVLLRTPSYVYNTIGMTAMTFAIGGISAWAPTYFVEHRMPTPPTPEAASAMKASVNTTFGGILVVAGLLATLAGGYAADWLKPRFSGSYFLVSGLSMLLGFPFFLGVLYAPFPLAWVFVFLAIFCLFFNTGPSNTIVSNVTSPAIRASAYAILIFIIHLLGDAISPVIIGAITDRTKSPAHPSGNMTLAFLVVGFTILLGGVFWLLGTPHLARDTKRVSGEPAT